MTARPSLDERAMDWMRERLRLASDVTETIAILRREGFAESAIINGFELLRPRGNALARGAMQALPLIRRAPHNLHRLDIPAFDAFTLDDFLTAAECAETIALVNQHLRPSSVADYAGGEMRTSQTAFLGHLHHPVADALDAKICRTLGIDASYSEGIQAQRYEPGQEFKPHFDAFQPGSDAYRRMASLRGNRTWTFMVYLNDVTEGGATRFTEAGYAVRPKAGMALLWYNLHADGAPNLATRHCGEPVISGCKIIITKWFRVHGHGPVFGSGSAE